jgi:hypothetical protein
MNLKDTRCLSPQAQEALRQRVVQAVEDGMTQVQAARVFCATVSGCIHK